MTSMGTAYWRAYFADPKRRARKNERKKVWSAKSKEIISSSGRAYRFTNRRLDNIRSYGLQVADYLRLLEMNSGRCHICDQSFELNRSNRVAIDHCHATNRVRGLLCQRCNTGLGWFEDVLLDRIRSYLEARWQEVLK